MGPGSPFQQRTRGCIGAAGTAVEQPMDRPAAAGCDHKGASKTWTWPR